MNDFEEDEAVIYQRKQRAQDLNVFLAVALAGALLFAIANSGWGVLMYGDWRCGFIECRVVVEQP